MKNCMFVAYLFLSIFNMAAVFASSQSDLYDGDVPPPVTSRGVYYTTTAMQGINSNNLEIEKVTEIITKNIDVIKKERYPFLKVENLYILLHQTNNSIGFEVTSVWKN